MFWPTAEDIPTPAMPAAAELRIDLAAEEANVEVLLFAFLFGISCYYYYVIKIIIRNYFCAILILIDTLCVVHYVLLPYYNHFLLLQRAGD